MRTKILLSTMLLLAGCGGTQSLDGDKKGGGDVTILEADSPIIITDGSSIHFRKANGFMDLGNGSYSVKITGSYARDLAVDLCTGQPAQCEAHLGSRNWVVTLYESDGTATTTLTHPGSGGKNTVDIQSVKSGSTLTLNGELVQSNAHLDHATASVNAGTTYSCPTSAPGVFCQMSIYRN